MGKFVGIEPARSAASPSRAAPVGRAGASDSAFDGVARLLNVLNCGALIVNRTGRIVAANAKLGALLREEPARIAGRTMSELCHNADLHPAAESAVGRFDEAGEKEGVLHRADGSELPVVYSARALEGPAPLCDHRVVTVLDMSRQKKAEEALREQYREVSELTDTVLEQALALRTYSSSLEERVAERTGELHDANMEAIYMLAIASEAKDADTGAHVRRMQHYADVLARQLGFAAAEVTRIGYSAILHDVGKMHVPDDVLRKPGPLTAAEWEIMQQHTLIGERILSTRPFFAMARQIARSHHENWNGTGYPDGLAGESIPMPARIVRVADVFDALISQRVYKDGWSPEAAATSIARGRGVEFDPIVVDAFEVTYAAGKINWTPPDDPL